MKPPAPVRPLEPLREALLLWTLSFGAIVLAFLLVPTYAKLVATVSFLYLPLIPLRRRGEDYRDYGLTLEGWKRSLKWALILFLLVCPPFVLVFMGYAQLLQHLPPRWGQILSPLAGPVHFHFRLPNRFGEWVVDQVLVVALPEEFFYRGYLQTRLRAAWPQGRVVLGARLGPAFWVTAVLFALGHLAIFQVWRLAVFFPGLLFGWLRERTGSVVGATAFHAACNLLELVLEASFFGRL